MTQYAIYSDGNEGYVDDRHVTQGKVLWLPAKEDLPERAVKRAHGKGAIEEGIYNHPVVVISRSSKDSHSIHFHLITSLQGKRLDQLYSKSNEFHASRRSWYLPIAPTPDHPDALSKKTKKRFPTLKLANDATLRWESYVNIRHVYKIDLSLLRPYSNPDTPDKTCYRFEGESMIRMLAKGKTLTMYEPGPQYVRLSLVRSTSEPLYQPTDDQHIMGDHTQISESSTSVASIIKATRHVAISDSQSVDFRIAIIDPDRIAGPPPKVPPDCEKPYTNIPFVLDTVIRPFDHFLGNIKSIAVASIERPTGMRMDPNAIARPLDQFWRDLKGVTAVVIASV